MLPPYELITKIFNFTVYTYNIYKHIQIVCVEIKHSNHVSSYKINYLNRGRQGIYKEETNQNLRKLKKYEDMLTR